jgi:hypothetical protein
MPRIDHSGIYSTHAQYISAEHRQASCDQPSVHGLDPQRATTSEGRTAQPRICRCRLVRGTGDAGVSRDRFLLQAIQESKPVGGLASWRLRLIAERTAQPGPPTAAIEPCQPMQHLYSATDARLSRKPRPAPWATTLISMMRS